MTCSDCGAEAEGTICLQCGAALRDPASRERERPEEAALATSSTARPEADRFPGESPSPASTRRRLFTRRRVANAVLILFVLLPVLTVLGVSVYFRVSGGNRLAAVVARLDETDPSWRWDDLQAARAQVPDSKNGALIVLAVARDLQQPWSPDLQAILKLAPNKPLSEAQVDLVYETLGPRARLQEESQKLAKLDTGRYPREAEKNKGATLTAYRLAECLGFQAALHAHLGRNDDACRFIQVLIQTGRASGDDPEPAAQLARRECDLLACRSLERALANGEVSRSALVAMEKLLAEEEAAPLLRHIIRGQRAQVHQLFLALESDRPEEEVPEAEDPDGQPARPAGPSTSGKVERWLKQGWIEDNHARALEFFNEADELSKQPAAARCAGFSQLCRRQRDSQTFLDRQLGWLAYDWFPRIEKFGAMEAERCALLACARAGLAVERYRLEKRAWPGSLAQLKPDFLADVPLAPDGKPLELRRLDDGVVIFAPLAGRMEPGPGTPQFRLWDESVRRPVVKDAFDAEVDLEKTVNRIYRKVMGKEPGR